MLRHQLGEDAFYRGLKHYLEVNRGKNVVTADLARAIEEATHVNIDQFLGQWVYGAGAPKFDLSYAYDNEKHQVALTVKQTQKVEGRVGIFRVPVEVEITAAGGSKLHPITVSKAQEIFTFPADSAPVMVLFDKGGQVLKTAEFHKEKKEWLHQLKNAGELADRADAAAALGKAKADDEIIAALGDALRHDKSWGVRATAADTLGKLGGASASKTLLDAVNSSDTPGVRNRVVTALGNFKDDPVIAAKLESLARQDNSYRARASCNGPPRESPSNRAPPPSGAWRAFRRTIRTSPNRLLRISTNSIFRSAWPPSSPWGAEATPRPSRRSKPF